LDLKERNANHIILSCCHMPVSCSSLETGVAPLGAVSHRFNFLIDENKELSVSKLILTYSCSHVCCIYSQLILSCL
jgi:hypothetical protein